MKMFKKGTAVLLCFVMCLSMVTFSALAAPTTIETLLSQAEVNLMAGNIDAAISTYTSVLSSDSKNVSATLGLAKAYEEKSNVKILLNNKMEILSDDVATKQDLYSLTAEDITNANRAREYYAKVITYTNQYNTEVYQRIIEIDWALGNTTQATTRLKEMLSTNSATSETYITLAAIYAESSDFITAKNFIDQALQQFPNDSKLLSFSVFLLYKMGNANLAYNEFIKIASLIDLPSYGYKFGGDILLSQHLYAEALECYETAIMKDYNMTITKSKYVTLQRAMGNSGSVLDKTTLNTLPYALVLLDQGKYQEAIGVLEGLLNTLPASETETIRMLLSTAYKNLGQLQTAYDYALGVTQLNSQSIMASYYLTVVNSYLLRSGSQVSSNNVSLSKKAVNLEKANKDYVIINGGAKYTNSTSVILDAYTSTRQVSFSNENKNWGSWITASDSRVTANWKLSSGDGVKTVNVRSRLLLFSGTEGTSDQIILDTKAPVASVIIKDMSSSSNIQLDVSLNATDESKVAGFWVSYDNDNWQWFDYNTSKFIYTIGNIGYTPASLNFYVMDVAGNYVYVSGTVEKGSNVSVNPSTPGTVIPGEITTTGIEIIGVGDKQPPTGGITLNNGASSTTSPYVTANLWYNDNSSTTGEMCFSVDGVNYTAWETFSSTKSLTLSGTSGQKYVYVKFRDRSYNVSQVYVASINLTMSQAAITISNIRTSTDFSGVTTITWNTSTPCMAYINIYVLGSSSNNFQQTTTSYETSHTARISGISAGVTYGFVLRCTDVNGNVVTSNEEIITSQQGQDTQAPTGSIVLNSGAKYTTSRTVTASISATDNSTTQIQMSISTDGSSFGSWENLSPTRQVQLPAGDGAKTVYIRFRDAAGNISMTYSSSITLDTTSPVISNFGIQSSGTNTVSVTWNTSELSTTYVEYYTGSITNMKTTGSGVYETSHRVTVSGLAQNTTYWFRVYSVDVAGNRGESSWLSFTTPRQNTTPPTVSFKINGGASITNNTNLTLDITAYDSQGEALEMCFRDDYTSFTSWQSYSSRVNWTTNSTNGTRTVYVKVRNASGYEAQAIATINIDTTAPTISNLQVKNITSNSMTVTWTTNESSTSWVYYGTNSSASQYTSGNNSMVTNHSVTLNNLSNNTTYYIKVQSTDAAGNMRESSIYSYRTSQPADTTPPNISNVQFQNITSNSMTITWNTNEAATSWIYYGTNSSASQYTAGNNSLVSNHSITINNLSSNTNYYIKIVSTDAAGNTRESSIYSYRTSQPADTTPPNISNVQFQNITSNSMTITWNTNEAATSWIYYGTNSSASQYTAGNNSLVTNHSITLNNLSSNTNYYIKIVSTDAAGNTRESSIYSYRTSQPADTTPPNISSVKSKNITSNSATITWSTNEAATSWVYYGTNSSANQYSAGNNSLESSHSISLYNLNSNTTYYYRVVSTDAAGNTRESSTYNFKTSKAADTTPPNISSVQSKNITSNGATITWSTNEAATSWVYYGTNSSANQYTSGNNSLVSSHSVTLNNLNSNTTYYYRVVSTDAAGNTRESSTYNFRTSQPADTTPPTISNIQFKNITNNSITVTWGTNEAATSWIYYGTNSSASQYSSGNNSLVTNHSITLNNLNSNTTYYIRVVSTDAAGNTRESSIYSSKTSQPSDTTPPNISNVQSKNVTTNSATINWSTNEAATSWVYYGTNSSANQYSSGNNSLVSSHSVTLNNLSSNTTYYYRVVSTDAAGNTRESSTYSFATSSSGGTTPPTEVKNTNVAAQSNGGTASASSYASASSSSFPATRSNDSSKSTYWQAKNSPTSASPEWVEVKFSGQYKINTITVTFTGGGVANDFKVQYLSSSGSWIDITSASGNSSTTWSKTFNTVETTAIRIVVTKSDGSIGPRIADVDVRYN